MRSFGQRQKVRVIDVTQVAVAVVLILWLGAQSIVSLRLQKEINQLTSDIVFVTRQLGVYRQEAENMMHNCMVVAEEVTTHLAINYGKQLKERCEGTP